MALTPEKQAEFDALYQAARQAVLRQVIAGNEQARAQQQRENAEHPRADYRPIGNLRLDSVSDFVTERERAQLEHVAHVPFVAGDNQSLAQFFLNRGMEMAEEIRQKQLDVMVYQTMAANTADTDLRREIQVLSRQTEDRVTKLSGVWNMTDALLKKLEGRLPEGRRLVPQSRYPSMSEEEKAQAWTISDENFAELMAAAPEALRKSIDEIEQLPVGPQAAPDTLSIHFADNPGIDHRKFRANMTKSGKQPTPEELDYAAGVYASAFSGAFDERQRQQLQNLGLEEFDLITIDGVSVSELFGEKYKDLEPEKRRLMLKAEVAAAAMDGSRNLAINRVRINEQGAPEYIGAAVITRSSDLHEPKPTLGQRFLNALGIRKLEPLKEGLGQANARFGEAKQQAEASYANGRGREPLERAALRLEREKMSRQYKKLNAVNTPEGQKSEFAQFFGCEFEARNSLEGFGQEAKTMGISGFTRPTTSLGLAYAVMLGQGHRLADIMDPEKLQAEKQEAGRTVEEALRTPEGLGKLLADATKIYNKLDLKAELSHAMGRTLDGPGELEAVMTGGQGMATVIPMMKKLYSGSREVIQAFGALYDTQNYRMLRMPDEETIQLIQMNKPEMQTALHSMLGELSDEDLQARQTLSDLNTALQKGSRLDIVANYLDSDELLRGEAIPETAKYSAEDASRRAMGLMDMFRRIAGSEQHSLGTLTVPNGDAYNDIALFRSEMTADLKGLSTQEIANALVMGIGTPQGRQVMERLIDPEDVERRNEQIRANEMAAQNKAQERMNQTLAARRQAQTAAPAAPAAEAPAVEAPVMEAPAAAAPRRQKSGYALLLEEEKEAAPEKQGRQQEGPGRSPTPAPKKDLGEKQSGKGGM